MLLFCNERYKKHEELQLMISMNLSFWHFIFSVVLVLQVFFKMYLDANTVESQGA